MSMTENENQDASSKKRFKTCDNDSQAQWSNLNKDMLLLIMMKLGYFDFPAFGGVCKSWRSFAVSNKNKFMESRPTMSLSVPKESKEEDYYCYLEDIEERCFISILPHSGGRTCVGFTCDHLILFGKESNDFWLLNPFTRHGVHFPDIPSLVSVDDPKKIRGVLVFSPLKSKWLFAITDGTTNIWFSIAGEGTWNHVSSTSPIADVDALNGKIYAIDNARHFYELTLDPEPKLMVHETKNFPNFSLGQWLKSLEESLYLQEDLSEISYKIYLLDFEDMNWVLINWIKKPSACIHNRLRHNAAVKHGKGKVTIWMINQ